MSNAYDHDDPRNFEDDRNEEARCPQCGGGHDDCRCGPNVQGFTPVCATCDDVGFITLHTTRYGKNCDALVEAIPCPCRDAKPEPDAGEPYEHMRRRIVQRAESYLRERGLDEGGK